MTHESIQAFEAFRPEVPLIQPKETFDAVERYRQENDVRLVALMQDLRLVLADRLPNADLQSQFHKFHFVERVKIDDGYQDFNRLLVVGPVRLGLGISEDSVSITKYHASDDSPAERQAIISHTAFVGKDIAEQLSGDAISNELQHKTMGVVDFPAIIWQDQERVDEYHPNVYAYTYGEKPLAELGRIAQLGVTFDTKKGWIYSQKVVSGENGEELFDTIGYAQDLVSILRHEDVSQYVGSQQIDFDYKHD